jgi:hypothetical protein
VSNTLADQLQILRDEVLDTATVGDRDPPGAEVFDAVVRGLMAYGETSPGLDLTLHDAISRRLAWGDREEQVLTDASAVCDRLMRATQRAFREPRDEMIVLETTAEVGCAAARIVALAAIGRAGRERAARLREELAQRRLEEALARQAEALSSYDP